MHEHISSYCRTKAFLTPKLPSLSHQLKHQLSHKAFPKIQTALQQYPPVFEENYQKVSCRVDYIGKNTVTLTLIRMPIYSRQNKKK